MLGRLPSLRAVTRRLRAGRAVADHAPQIAVLSYHRIAEPTFDPWGLSVSAANFADQLATLTGIGRFLPLDDMLASRRRAWGPRPNFVVTFDDGYADNLQAALPVLERHDVPATVFVSTGSLDGRAFWWDVLDEAVLDPDRPIEALVAAAGRAGLLAGAHSTTERAAIHAELHAALARRAAAGVVPLLEDILAAIPDPPAPSGRPLTTAELVELAAHPLVSIGVHTVHHVRLPNASTSEARRELTDARDRLDRLIGPAPRALAYPHGDANADVAALAASLGFTCAVTTDHRWVAPADDRMLLPRLTVTDVGGAELRARLEAA